VRLTGGSWESFGTASRSTAVTIPAEAIATSGDQSIVYVVHDSIVERRVVQLGAKIDTRQTVIAGIRTGPSYNP
jgi:hypothetical protein